MAETIPFNSSLGNGLRALIVLAAIAPDFADLQRLVLYDFILVHSGDVGGPSSIHPSTPSRGGELIVRRGLVEQGVMLMASRNLIERFADEHGIGYRASEEAYLRKRGLSDRTVSNRHKLTVAFLKFASVAADAIPKASPKFGSTVPEVYTPKELKAFFKSLRTDYHRVVFNLALKCGLREQELMHVYWADIDFVHKTLIVRSKPEWNFKIKDQEERSIPLADDLLKLLKSYRAANPGRQLVTGTSGDKPSTKLLRTLKRLVHHAELNCTVCKGCVARNECEEWFLHKFRATFITTLLRSGMDLRTVMQLSGHSDLKSVMRYLRPAEGSELRTRMNQVAWGI